MGGDIFIHGLLMAGEKQALQVRSSREREVGKGLTRQRDVSVTFFNKKQPGATQNFFRGFS